MSDMGVSDEELKCRTRLRVRILVFALAGTGLLTWFDARVGLASAFFFGAHTFYGILLKRIEDAKAEQEPKEVSTDPPKSPQPKHGDPYLDISIGQWWKYDATQRMWIKDGDPIPNWGLLWRPEK